MKKLALLAFFYCAFSYAADKWLEMPNNAGGKIILLQSGCDNTGTGRLVIATTPQGKNVMGCWYYFADMIHVAWKTGDSSSFNPNDFVAKENK